MPSLGKALVTEQQFYGRISKLEKIELGGVTL